MYKTTEINGIEKINFYLRIKNYLHLQLFLKAKFCLYFK